MKEVGKKKLKLEDNSIDKDLLKTLKEKYKEEIAKSIIARVEKEYEGDELKILSENIASEYAEKYDKSDIEKALNYLFDQKIREDVIKKGKRVDGRDITTIRNIEGEVSLLPRTHGSAMFKRGQTQVLTVATLGSPSLEQLIESP